jgi:hypothetical protein
MAVIEAPGSLPFSYGGHLYVRAPDPIHFPAEESLEEAVSETKRHLEARTTLYLLLRDAFAGAGSAVGSEQFVYWDPRDPRKCLSPDAFVKLGCQDEPFETWKTWERGAPDLAVEIVSASDQGASDWSEKLERYERCGVRELVRFDADDQAQPIRVWDRVGSGMVERAGSDPRLRACSVLGMWWVVVPSPFGPQIRLARDQEGRALLPTPSEDRVRLAAELAEERRARVQAEHEREVERHERKLAEEARAREAEARAREAEARVQAEARTAEVERELRAAQAEIARFRAERGKVDKP